MSDLEDDINASFLVNSNDEPIPDWLSQLFENIFKGFTLLLIRVGNVLLFPAIVQTAAIFPGSPGPLRQ
jgi:hypothetical protein